MVNLELAILNDSRKLHLTKYLLTDINEYVKIERYQPTKSKKNLYKTLSMM